MRRAALVTLVAVVAAGVWLGRSGNPPDDAATAARVARPAGDVPTADPNAIAHAPITDAPADPLARPRSLRGTRIDGGLATDTAGRFVPTLDARRLFDYFLTASGEAPDDVLRARIQREIERRLAPAAAREATALLDRYLAYRERVRALATVEAPDDGDLDTRLATLIAIRREVLGPAAAAAFFAEEEADAHRMLEARRIANEPSLTPDERAARVEAIFAEAEADLPAEVRAARATARLATTLRTAEAEIRARGGGDDEIAAARERLAGPEAAARLAELDRRRGAWQGRVDAFRAARDRLRDDPTLPADARAAAVTRLFEESFTTAERRRVEALDRIAAESAAIEP